MTDFVKITRRDGYEVSYESEGRRIKIPHRPIIRWPDGHVEIVNVMPVTERVRGPGGTEIRSSCT